MPLEMQIIMRERGNISGGLKAKIRESEGPNERDNYTSSNYTDP